MDFPYPVYCGGRFLKTPAIINVTNPCDQSAVGSCCQAGNDELEQAITKALETGRELRRSSCYERASWLTDIATGLQEKRDELALLLSREACKPLRYALGEVDRATEVFRIAAEETKRIPGELLSIDWTPAGKGRQGWVKYFPVGLVAGIAPFNFPLNLSAHKIAPALAAACPIILKPASRTPLTALRMAEIIDTTKVPKGAVSIMPMDRGTGNRLVTDERFKLLSFTGSPEVGWQMKADAGRKKVLLELGGNAGVIVSDSANLQVAVQRCLLGGFSYAGQVCIHTQRIYVADALYMEFLERFVKAVKSLKAGKPENPDTEFSAMIDVANARRVEQWVKDAAAAGAKVLCGGKRQGAFLEPTVITGSDFSMQVCCKEIFGPVVTVEPYQSFEQAVEWINNSEFGLQAGVFTDRVSEMDYAFEKIETGGVIINDVPTFRVDHMPYGGIKNSGLGREGVKYAMLEMMEPKLMVR